MLINDVEIFKTNYQISQINSGYMPLVHELCDANIRASIMVRFLLLVLSASFAYIIFQAKLSLLSILITIRCSSTGTPDDSCASVDRD